ncbi:MAG: hypothetical protein ACIAQZ_00095 [Sedimentisphaeraceae bacterium JB056]
MFTHKVYVAVIVCALTACVIADCDFAHTHIGINPTWRPDWSDPTNSEKATDTDSTDDNRLWFFSVPPVHGTAATGGWPNWLNSKSDVFLLITPVEESGSQISKGDGSGKILWTCNFTYGNEEGYGASIGLTHINGWHSAHGPQGKWNLESIDENTEPAWVINIRRKSTSLPEDDFLMALHDDTAVLTANGDTYEMPKEWLVDKNAWGFHQHMTFYFWLLPEFEDEVTVTFSAFDTGGMYDESANFIIRFAPEVCDPIDGDINGDCIVNIIDLKEMAGNWLKSGIYNGN